MNRVLQDLRFALRTLRRAPGYAAGSILLLGLGIAAVTSSFTLFDNILLRSLPYPEADRIAVIEDGSHSGPFWRALHSHASVETWGAAWATQADLTGQGDPTKIDVAQVSEDFLRLFGAKATAGRLLVPEDYDTRDRVVLSFDFWQRAYGLDRAVLGQTITLDGKAAVVVGVVERSFVAPEGLVRRSVDVWRPMPWGEDAFLSPNYYVLEVAARLANGVSVEQFKAETQATVVHLDQADTDRTYRDREGQLWQVPVSLLQEVTVGSARNGLVLLLGAVGLLLLIACANVAHLSVARGIVRRKEMAIRRALGASGTSLLRQLLVEGLVVATLGGALGLALAYAAVQVFTTSVPIDLPRGGSLALDLRVVVFSCILSASTVLVFSLLPALLTIRAQISRSTAKTAGHGKPTRWLRNGLVTMEVALSLTLLIGAGVLLRSYTSVNQQETGIEAERVWRVPLAPPEEEEPGPYLQLTASISDALRTVPGVDSVGYGLTVPFASVGGSRCCWRTRVRVTENPDSMIAAMVHPVSAGYFETLGIQFARGRSWTQRSTGTVPVAVVLPEVTAAELFGSESNAMGQSLTIQGLPELVVAGVATDVRHYGLDQQIRPSIYIPIEHIPFGVDLADFVLKVRGTPPIGFAASVRKAIWQVAPDLPISTVESMPSLIDSSTAERRFESILFGGFGIVALLLAAAGLYSTLLYGVSQRKREMGIRLALGARRARVEGQVLLTGLAFASIGALLGLSGAWAATSLLESRIWGVEARDTASMIGATALLLLTSTAACWLPAREAGRTDPVEALRAE